MSALRERLRELPSEVRAALRRELEAIGEEVSDRASIAEAKVDELLARLQDVDGVECALSREEACARFELPADRVGDLVVISSRRKVIGATPERHDLSALDEPLRSHGGLSEQRVPFIINRPLDTSVGDGRLRNYDIFHAALNAVQ